MSMIETYYKLIRFLFMWGMIPLFLSCSSYSWIKQKPIKPYFEIPPYQTSHTGNTFFKSSFIEKTPYQDVKTIMANMTLEEKIGQLFMVKAYGYFYSEDNEEYDNLITLVKDYHVGGIMFLRGHVYGQTILSYKMNRYSKYPLWIAQDMEFGPAMRLQRTTWLPPAMGIAATGDPNNAYLAGQITAREAKALGVHQIFAPVLDVNSNPKNPVINVRAFSEDPQAVATFGTAFIRGVKSENVVATAKHFPGHGDTEIDSHIGLPILKHGEKRLNKVDLYPFKIAIEEGVPSIMSAHIAFPKLLDGDIRPATINDNIIENILRKQLQYDGMVITDALDMGGITSNHSPGEAVIEALKAGVDIMLLSPDEKTAIFEVLKVVKQGGISLERIENSVKRILEWKIKHGLFREPIPNILEIEDHVNIKQHQAISNYISQQSVTLVKNKKNILPLRAKDYKNILAISVADDESGTTGLSMRSSLLKYHPGVTFKVYDKRSNENDEQAIIKAAEKADLIIIGTFVYVRSYRPLQLSSSQTKFVNKLLDMKIPKVLISFGNPYIVSDFKKADVQLLAWSARSQQVRNTIPALFSSMPIQGKLPISIPKMYKRGHGITMPQTTLGYAMPEFLGISSTTLSKVDTIMENAIFDEVFPGGVVAVVKDNNLIWQKGYGYHTYEKHIQVRKTDVYDIASLTKIVATTTAIMKLIDEKRCNLNDPISKYFDEYKHGEKANVTLAHLLTHTSGLPYYREYVDSLTSRQDIMEAVLQEPLVRSVGEYKYSDIGFMLLGVVVEKITNERLDNYVRKNIFYPLNMRETRFNPYLMGDWFKKRIPPTEKDDIYRMKLVHAEVHDERAYYMDGVSGAAGLFSSASDLAIWATLFLQKGQYAEETILKPETVELFTKGNSLNVNRGLGFDHKSGVTSTAGQYTSNDTYGHLGFTGTSIWVDPQHDLAIILLTNRVYPKRTSSKNINRVRASIADAITQAVIKTEK